MKKSKVLVFLMVLVLSLSAVSAQAAVCYHKHTSEVLSGWNYVEWSSETHQVLYKVTVVCRTCGDQVDLYSEGYFEPHTMVGKRCKFCDFSINDLPTSEALQREALQRVTEDPEGIIGKTALVIHNGNIRAGASTLSADLGAVIADDKYEIVNYVVDGSNVWLEVKYGLGTAWVSAGLARISGANAANNKYAEFYVGRTCTIKVSSGRARMAPDKDSPVLEYIKYGEQYTILDCESAVDDTLWFKIVVDNDVCWISSGIATIN